MQQRSWVTHTASASRENQMLASGDLKLGAPALLFALLSRDLGAISRCSGVDSGKNKQEM
jgi:hypothetical protein